MEREEGGELGLPDTPRDFIAIDGQSSLRPGHHLDEEAREDEQGWEGLDREPLDPRRAREQWELPPPLATSNPRASDAPRFPYLPADSPLGPP